MTRPASGLAGKVALVTGAGRRIGRAIAIALAEEGVRVAVHFHASAEGARDTVAAIEGTGAEARSFRADLGKAGSPERLVAKAARHFGRLDVLVNSAASMTRTPLDTITSGQWDEILGLNLRAPFFASIAAARAMGEAGGAIVNISDHMGFEPWTEFLPHGVSKAGVAAMTHALAAALAPRVRVNAVVPGAVLPPEGWPEDARARYASETPLLRIGTPEDVAQAVVYFARAEYVTGETLFVDGGRHGAR